MWAQLREILNTVQRINFANTQIPIATAITNALTYYPSLRWDYVAIAFTGVGLAAGSMASVAKNLQELSASIRLEQEIRERHEMVKKYLQESTPAANAAAQLTMPPLPVGLVGSPFYNQFGAAPHVGAPLNVVAVGQAPAGGQQYQTLHGITHYERLATGSYVFSGLIGMIAAMVLTYRLVTCNREEDPESSAPECYDVVDTILIVIVVVAMLMLIATHSIIAGGLRKWRNALEDNMRQLNEYLAEKVKDTIPNEIKDIAKLYHESTKNWFDEDATSSIPQPVLSSNIFSSLKTLSALIANREPKITQRVAKLQQQNRDKEQQITELQRQLKDREQRLAIARQRFLEKQLERVDQFFKDVKLASGENINLGATIDAMQAYLRNDSGQIEKFAQQTSQNQLRDLLSQHQTKAEAHLHKLTQLKQRLMALTTGADYARLTTIRKSIIAELTRIKAALEVKESSV